MSSHGGLCEIAFSSRAWEEVFASEIVLESEGQVIQRGVTAIDVVTEGVDGITNFRLAHLDVMFANSLNAAEGALQCVVDSSPDQCFGMDLEWRPDYGKGRNNRIAVIQVSSWSRAVVLQISSFGFQLPNVLSNLFLDRNATLVMLGAASNDFSKLESTFGITPKHIMARVVDVQVIARECGRTKLGLQNLTQVQRSPYASHNKATIS
jgi:hypothetical protein